MKVKRNFLTLLMWTVCLCSAYAQDEVFVDETVGGAANAVTSGSVSSQQAAGAAAAGAVVVAQASGSAVESADEGELADADEEEYDDEEGDLVDQYSLPRSTAPVAVDQSLISGSPVGQNTQRSVSRPPGVAIDSSIGFFPSLTLGYSWNDNPARSNDPESDAALNIVPNIVLRSAINNRHPYELGVTGSIDSFDQFSNLDETNVVYYAALKLDMSEKLQADLYADYEDGTDPRGATATRIIDDSEENDEYNRFRYGGRLTIGRRSNTLQAVLLAEREDINYTNNNQESRDRTNDTLGAGLFWNVGPVTSVFLRTEQTDIDYNLASSSGFDSTETRNTIGVGWQPTFNTSLIFEVGNLEKDLADPALEDYNDETYAGRISWSPVQRFRAGLYASKTTEETVDRSSPYTLSQLIGVDASYSFTDRFRTNAYYNIIDDDVVNVREDDITDYGIGVFYDLTRWLTLGGGWQHTDRDSTDPAAAYEENIYSITATIRAPKNVEFETIQVGDELQPVQ